MELIGTIKAPNGIGPLQLQASVRDLSMSAGCVYDHLHASIRLMGQHQYKHTGVVKFSRQRFSVSSESFFSFFISHIISQISSFSLSSLYHDTVGAVGNNILIPLGLVTCQKVTIDFYLNKYGEFVKLTDIQKQCIKILFKFQWLEEGEFFLFTHLHSYLSLTGNMDGPKVSSHYQYVPK